MELNNGPFGRSRIQLYFLATILAFAFTSGAYAQSVSALQSAYSGKIKWEGDSGHLTFTSSGIIDFKRDKMMSGIWTVPTDVTQITIGANVRVTGQFTLRHDCTIEGEDQKTSILYGTDTPSLLRKNNLDGGGGCIPYSAVLGKGKIVLQVKNLTTLNPIGFMWTGKKGCRIHLDGVRGIDDRGGWRNHSDGISAAKGSTVRNCYLETGDDAIKVYADITVENTTIKMIRNCVPIQLGWGSHGNNARGTFRNLTILGGRGRGKIPAVIVGRRGTYHKSIDIDGLSVEHPTGALVSLYEKGMELDLTVKNANISVKQFWGRPEGICNSTINGSTEQVSRYTPAQKATGQTQNKPEAGGMPVWALAVLGILSLLLLKPIIGAFTSRKQPPRNPAP